MTLDNTQRCQVTGRTLPAEDLVTFQGMLVSAEGKQILIERLKSGKELPSALERPTFLRRFGSWLLDCLALITLCGIAMLIWVVSTGSSSEDLVKIRGWLPLAAVITQFIYLWVAHARYGQTVGKFICHLRVVNRDGSPISVGTAFLRAFIFVLPGIFRAIALLSGDRVMLNVSAKFGSLIWILIIAMALADRKMQRSLHDRIAGTRVIQE